MKPTAPITPQLYPSKKVGKWTLGAFTPGGKHTTPRSYPKWLCTCECGTTRQVRDDQLKVGKSLSCGCTNGPAKSRLFGEVFSDAVQRRPRV